MKTERKRPGNLIIDTNLLLLLVIGRVDGGCHIASSKRLKSFDFFLTVWQGSQANVFVGKNPMCTRIPCANKAGTLGDHFFV